MSLPRGPPSSAIHGAGYRSGQGRVVNTRAHLSGSSEEQGEEEDWTQEGCLSGQQQDWEDRGLLPALPRCPERPRHVATSPLPRAKEASARVRDRGLSGPRRQCLPQCRVDLRRSRARSGKRSSTVCLAKLHKWEQNIEFTFSCFQINVDKQICPYYIQKSSTFCP